MGVIGMLYTADVDSTVSNLVTTLQLAVRLAWITPILALVASCCANNVTVKRFSPSG